MRKLKKILFISFAVMLMSCLFSCGSGDEPCKTHSDGDNDGKCDKCGEATNEEQSPEGEIVLVEDSEAKFQIVYADSFSSMLIGKVNKMKSDLLGVGIKVDRVPDKSNNIKECEILIGNVKTRGDKYKTDGHDYGFEGYVIKMIDSKIIINAGSEGALIEAIDKFLKDIVEINNKEKDVSLVIMKSNQQVEMIQDNYKITSLSVDGKDMKGYTLSVNKNNSYHMEAAKVLQQTFYERTG